ncbi:MAG: DUF547 domain-containing protein [Candidatus Competibacteraceae bacterium]|nr:DUF547 domain-containing protein [Candidatus Competibacteraceae bacterium]HRY15412.1 DUF547 domain-containing protein [Candidatus Competibacteraceae bacterium]
MKKLLAILTLMLMSSAVFAFDHRHTDWEALLKRHVVLITQGNASQVDYAGFKTDQTALQQYLDALSAVSEADYRRWSKPQQLAFLINAYNAFTIELILTRYPDLKSIKDLGSILQSPWKKTFFTLLGQERSLDEVEHGMIRAPGVFNEPRIHAAVNCASIGCPMLRNEAFVADRLDQQLEDSMRRFLADRSRNRFDAARNTLSVSKIFDWYQGDFEKGYQGFTSLDATFARYADALGDTPQAQAAIRQGGLKIQYLDYDWALNAKRR